MRKVLALLATVLFVATAGVASAVDAPVAPTGTVATSADAIRIADANRPRYAPLGMGITVIGVGVGLGLIGFVAMGGIARQPEQAGNIRTAMLIIGGLVEGAGIIALVLCFVAG